MTYLFGGVRRLQPATMRTSHAPAMRLTNTLSLILSADSRGEGCPVGVSRYDGLASRYKCRMRSGVVVFLVVGLATAAPTLGKTGVPPPGLSSKGRALWNFEALLHD